MSRPRIGILYTGDTKILAETISILSNKFDMLLILDFVPEGVKAVVIPETEGYNTMSGAVRPFRKLPANPLSVSNAYLLNFLEYGLSGLKATGVKLAALGYSALTVADSMNIKIHVEENNLLLEGESVIKTADTYLNVRNFQSCYDEVIRFIEGNDDGTSYMPSQDNTPNPVLHGHNPEPEV